MPRKGRETPTHGRAVIELLFRTDEDALLLAKSLRAAARQEDDRSTRERLKTIAHRVIEDTVKPKKYRPKVRRPKDDDDGAVERVVAGLIPYPVLSKQDARRALLEMRFRDVSLVEMANRLYMDPRSVSRLIRAHKEGKWE